MKTFNLASALFVTVVAVAPSIAAASAANRSADACAQAFATQLTSSGSAAPVYKLDYQAAGADSLVADYYATRYTFELSAHQPNSKSNIARATCITSRTGKVLSLITRPTVTDYSKLAASY